MKTILSHRLRAREAVYLRLFYRSLLIALLVLFVSYTVEANVNSDSGAVMVDVFDSKTNESIPFTNVVAYQNGIQVAVGTTNMDGRFLFRNLLPGKYDVKAIYVGYQSQEIKGIEVGSGRTAFLTFKLEGRYEIVCYETYCCCCFGCGYSDNTENWWPKLWTPYREAYAAWKEKRKAKQAEQKEIKLSEEPDVVVTVDSIAPTRIIQTTPIAEQIKIFPNPCSDVLNVESLQPLQNLILMDEGGKIVREEMMQNPTTNIMLNGLANGIYHLIYFSNGKSETKKIVVANQ